jgi:hypothetical protein
MKEINDLKPEAQDRRAFLNTFGKAAIIAPPVVTAMLSTSMASPAIAASTGGNKGPKGNNGLGNGPDPQPPGNPKVNDGPGSGPGHPHNGGGSNAHLVTSHGKPGHKH